MTCIPMINAALTIKDTPEFKLNQLNHLKKRADAEGSTYKDYKDYVDYLNANFPIGNGTGGKDAKFEQGK